MRSHSFLDPHAAKGSDGSGYGKDCVSIATMKIDLYFYNLKRIFDLLQLMEWPLTLV